MTKRLCDHCGKAITAEHIRVRFPHELFPEGMEIRERDLCSWACLRAFAAERNRQ